MDKTYILVQIRKNDKYTGAIITVADYDNLVHKLKIDGIIGANAFKTRKEAESVLRTFREYWIQDNEYLYQ